MLARVAMPTMIPSMAKVSRSNLRLLGVLVGAGPARGCRCQVLSKGRTARIGGFFLAHRRALRARRLHCASNRLLFDINRETANMRRVDLAGGHKPYWLSRNVNAKEFLE